ncbi:BON domain-containing protein [Aliivibrio fischeri]|uniref:BON domain-containing protein n=3 Tax=Aliivibrio fischeri TaxID=668 RepID=A0A6I3Y9R8_ALIFS|nr:MULTISPECIES: BON domain-containing protein [Aliivibrio]ACH66702.1 21 kDa hemolysin [Aliivibrio fischeri MJ11]EHN69313.1 21 kDa hemolysin [Aliivibrio fischeri SR5]MBD1568611.1 BON domain-containing protein [Aliivibrio sp. S10_S31]MCE4936030.1 BON domain-containing protein [Aliivibrio fischeri]MUH98219.1 BON domain-containing protein [Aliivibrio fischeri]
MKLVKLSALLLSAVLLQGCAGLFIAGAATTASVVTDNRTVKEQLSDKNLSLEATGLANKAPYQYNMRVNAVTYDGKVLLMGQAKDAQMNQEFEKKIKDMKGVNTVYNQIRVRPLLTFTQINNDSWITTKVKSSLLAKSELNGIKISVFTEAQEVFLVGFVTEEQGNIAADVARNIKGVKGVIKAFEYGQGGSVEQ